MTTLTTAEAAAPEAAADTDDEFLAAFAEFTADDGRDEGEDGADADAPAELGDDDGDGAPEGTKDETRKDEAPADDLWAGAKPEAKAAYEAALAERQRLEHASKSDRGRVSRLTKELEAYRAAQKSAPAKAEEPEDEEVKAFVEEYPEVAGPVRKMLSRVEKEAEELRAARAQAEADRALQAMETSLAERHPDWIEQVQRPEFASWLETQPQYVIQAAVRNADRITNADEAADLIGRFKATMPATQPTQPNQAASAAPPNLAARRQRQLESAHAVRSRGPGPADAVPDDFEAAFAHYAAKDARKRQA